MLHSLKSKIIVPTVIILILLIITMTFHSSVSFTRYVNTLFDESIVVTAKGIHRYLQDCEVTTETAAVSISTDVNVIRAVQSGDIQEILQVLTPALVTYNVDFCTVINTNGVVLARTIDHQRYGDSLLEQQNVKDALAGKVTTYCVEGTISKISVRSSAPIYDFNGLLIGIVTTGMRLDINEAMYGLKEYFDADFTAYHGNIAVASTKEINGQPIIGTSLDPEIAKIVLEEKKTYTGKASILGESFGAYYLPLLDAQDNAFAVIMAGHSNAPFIAKERSMRINSIMIGLLGLAISVIVLLIITTRIIEPISLLMDLVTDLYRGKVDVKIELPSEPKDEIAELTHSTAAYFEIIRTLQGELSQLILELDIYGEATFTIDADKYMGTYKELIQGINTLVDSVATMKKTVAVTDYLDTMICVTDLDHHLLYVNRSLADTFGLDRYGCIGEKCYKALRHLDAPCSICQLPNIIDAKDSYPSIDYEYMWDEVSGAWIGGRAAIMRWVDGEMVFFNSINNETAKKMHREQLREAVELAEAASAAKSAFLANMSHELRTPLNVVVGLADLQLEDPLLSKEVRENLHKISTAGNTLLNIVNDILDISKIESGNFSLNPVEYHMASLLNDTAILITSRIDEKPIRFHLNIDEDLPSKLYGDDLRVKQILNNLLSNAIKYTNEGMIELKVQCVREGDTDVWMEITIKDTGIGIRPEGLKKLFTDYNQVDTRANRKVEGTGLGLAITKKLAESMSGTISAKSKFGKGSTFCVRILQGHVNDIPIGARVADNLRDFRYSENKRQLASNLVRDNLNYAKVLVVDDLQTNLDVAAGMMRKYNMQVDCVTNGHEAIRRIKRGDPIYNAVFMDHMMPEMDGVETADIIRSLGTDYAKSIPIIALTANAVSGTEELFYEHGFQAYITKPIDIIRLDAIIARWIKNKDADIRDELPTQEAPGEQLSATSAVEKQVAFAEEEKATLEIPGVVIEKGLAVCGGDMKLYKSILRTYINDAKGLCATIQIPVTLESLPAYTVAVHGLKGSSANIGAEEIRTTAAALEAMAKAGDLAGVRSNNEALLEKTAHLLTAIKDLLDQKEPSTTKPLLPAPDQAILEHLLQYCQQFDAVGAEKAMDELEKADYEEDADLIAWLREKLDTLDFFEIIDRLEKDEPLFER